jgi:hypothetical protein
VSCLFAVRAEHVPDASRLRYRTGVGRSQGERLLRAPAGAERYDIRLAGRPLPS